MEFELRDWLLILGPVFVCAVLLHGYWRMRTNRNSLRMSLDKTYLSATGEDSTADDLSMFKAELPNGGARIIKKPEQTSLALSQDVPVLMDPVKAEPQDDKADNVKADVPLDDDVLLANVPEIKAERASVVSSEPGGLQSIRGEPTVPTVAIDATPNATTNASTNARTNSTTNAATNAPTNVPTNEPTNVPTTTAPKAPPAQKAELQHGDKPEKFIIVNVLANDGLFAGSELLNTLGNHGMAHGEMDIFHRLNDQAFSEFSLTNAVEPGTFDLSTMDTQPTPGVTLFMRVHELADPIHVYDEMIDVAQAIADELGGTVLDETRSVVTMQTVEHCRQGIRDFQYRHSA